MAVLRWRQNWRGSRENNEFFRQTSRTVWNLCACYRTIESLTRQAEIDVPRGILKWYYFVFDTRITYPIKFSRRRSCRNQGRRWSSIPFAKFTTAIDAQCDSYTKVSPKYTKLSEEFCIFPLVYSITQYSVALCEGRIYVTFSLLFVLPSASARGSCNMTAVMHTIIARMFPRREPVFFLRVQEGVSLFARQKKSPVS